jgi:hypothetical protein
MRAHVGLSTVALSLLIAGTFGVAVAKRHSVNRSADEPGASAEHTPPKALPGIVSSIDKDAGRVVVSTQGQGVLTLATDKLDVADMNTGDRVMVQVQLQKGTAATSQERKAETGGVASGARARGTSAQASPATSGQFEKAIPVTGTIERIDKEKGFVSVRGENDQRIENLKIPPQEAAPFEKGDHVTALVAIARGTAPGGAPNTSGAGGGAH